MNNRTGELIEKYRKEKGLTQEQLAKALGVSNSAISKWEHGTNLPDITLIEPLSEILGIDKLLLFTSEHDAKEVSSERCKTIKKHNLLKITIISILFIFSIIFTNFISYKVYKHKLDELELSQTKVYRFYSKDDEYLVNGYIIQNTEESVVIFDKLEYQDSHNIKLKSSNKQEDIVSAELYFEVNEKVIYKNILTNISKNSNAANINDILLKLKNKENKRFNIKRLDIENTKFKIIINYKNKKKEKCIDVEIHEQI